MLRGHVVRGCWRRLRWGGSVLLGGDYLSLVCLGEEELVDGDDVAAWRRQGCPVAPLGVGVGWAFGQGVRDFYGILRNSAEGRDGESGVSARCVYCI